MALSSACRMCHLSRSCSGPSGGGEWYRPLPPEDLNIFLWDSDCLLCIFKIGRGESFPSTSERGPALRLNTRDCRRCWRRPVCWMCIPENCATRSFIMHRPCGRAQWIPSLAAAGTAQCAKRAVCPLPRPERQLLHTLQHHHRQPAAVQLRRPHQCELWAAVIFCVHFRSLSSEYQKVVCILLCGWQMSDTDAGKPCCMHMRAQDRDAPQLRRPGLWTIMHTHLEGGQATCAGLAHRSLFSRSKSRLMQT